MDKYNSDDLLYKSQMLIAKFRKQRELSSKKQDIMFNKIHKKTAFSPELSNYTPKLKFQSSNNRNYVSSNIINRNNGGLMKLNFNEEEYRNNNASSNGSDWSDGEPASPPTKLPQKDSTAMTDQSNQFDVDDIVTPLTAVTPTVRSTHFTNHSNPANSRIQYSSICTTVENQSNHYDTLDSKDNETNSNPLPPKIDENCQINDAVKLLKEEKQLEQDLTGQFQRIEEINQKIQTLTEEVYQENEKYDQMKYRKSELAAMRLDIFNGLTKELSHQLSHSVASNSGSPLRTTPVPSHDANISQNPVISLDTNCANNKTDYSIDNQIIQRIVNKVIHNEFSSTEDDTEDDNLNYLFHNIHLHTGNGFVLTNQHNNGNHSNINNIKIGDSGDDENAILSDVLSIKDLKIKPPFSLNADMDSKSNSSTMKSANNKRPPNPSRKMKTAQSVDNLVRISKSPEHSKSGSRSSSRRKYVRSPAISDINHRSTRHHSASSSDTL